MSPPTKILWDLYTGEGSIQSARRVTYTVLATTSQHPVRTQRHSLQRACCAALKAAFRVYAEQYCIITTYWMLVPLRRQTNPESPGQAISLHTGESPANQNGVPDRLGIAGTKIGCLKLKWACRVTPRMLGYLSLGGFTLGVFCGELSPRNWRLTMPSFPLPS